MRLVVLDGYTLNPGDLSWDGLRGFGELVVHDRSAPDEVPARIAGAELVFTNKSLVPGEVIRGAESLRYIGVLATGFNIVDVAAASARGVAVCNVPGYGPESVAQMVFAHILNFCQRVAEHGESVKAGDWSAQPDFCYWRHPLQELRGQTIGIVGLGAIGGAVARIAAAFGMRVLATTRNPARTPPHGVAWADLDTVVRESDFLSLHCPLTPENRGMINAKRLSGMKPTAFLINTGRGPLVDEAALADALERGVIAGAGLDVLSVEPPPPDNPLLRAPGCVITPHIAWATRAARSRLLAIAVDNVEQFLAGNPVHRVNP